MNPGDHYVKGVQSMSDRKIYDTAEIRRVAQEFISSSHTAADLLSKVRTLVGNLEGSFKGVAATKFFNHFQDQITTLQSTVSLYEDIGNELNSLATRVEQFDASVIG